MKFYIGQRLRMLENCSSNGKGRVITVVILKGGKPGHVETDGSWGWGRGGSIPREYISRTGHERYWYISNFDHDTGWEEVVDESKKLPERFTVLLPEREMWRPVVERILREYPWRVGHQAVRENLWDRAGKETAVCVGSSTLAYGRAIEKYPKPQYTYEEFKKLYIDPKMEGEAISVEMDLSELKTKFPLCYYPITLNPINITNPSVMSKIVKFAKELKLSKSEKLLRKHGLKNECGDYTHEAVEIEQQTRMEEFESRLVDIAKAMEEEERGKKK